MLKNVILNQKQEKERFLAATAQYVERTQAKFSQKWMDSHLIKVILGPRRAGKSIFSFMSLKNRPFMYFNFDDEILANEAGLSTHEFMKELHSIYGDTKTLFCDEIQNLPHWELFVNRLHREGYNLVLTGSNAHLLSKELASALTGRHIPIEILPFGFKEYLRAKKITTDVEPLPSPQRHSTLLKQMDEFLLEGGFPDVVVNHLDSKDYLRVLFDSLLFKDVVKRHKIKFPTEIGNLGSHLINNFSSLYSLRKLQDRLHFRSDTTTKQYTQYLEEAYLLFSVLRFSHQSAERIKSPRKVYVVDNGFVTAKSIQHSPNAGKLMENLVLTELVKRGYKPSNEIFYYKTRNNREVNFVIKNGTEVSELIQVCYEAHIPEVEKRAIKALVEAGDELKAKKLTIITRDEKREIREKKTLIQFVPLWEWALNL